MDRTFLSSANSKMKESWEREYNKFDKDYPYGYPWPPRYYTCSFCQREFKSAQALGGHMNIHRKDRARLRDLSPDKNQFLSTNKSSTQNPNFNHYHNPNSNPNPNPNPMSILPSSSSSCQTNNIYSQQYSMVSLSLSSIPSSSSTSRDNLHHFHGVGKCRKISSVDNPVHNCNNDNNTSLKEVARLDFGLYVKDAKKDDELDLELRLGI